MAVLSEPLLTFNPPKPGGSNPAIRTLFYRLVRLLGLAIHPIFVFDGPNKPAIKRNKRSGRGDGVATAMAKRLIRLFGFAIHDAPGEAEAECALLEREGVVDAVLSEDVDTIMFGCRRTLRNWSAEGRGSKTPTHVTLYDAGAVAAGPSGLDREGMVLVALISGGDYLPEGVPGCGVKVACEAARAGFGRELCRLKRADEDGLKAWKQRLQHELRTNESGYFRTKHNALHIPDNFPNVEVLRFYTHPVVSRQTTIDRLRGEFPSRVPVDIVGLREFVRETFDWTFRIGAVKLIRVLAPSLLVQKFLERYASAAGQLDDLDLKKKEESALIKVISGKRVHFSTDATPELRISIIPAEIVKLDLCAEPEEEAGEFGREGLALNSDGEFDEAATDEPGSGKLKTSNAKPFDPLQPDLVWIPETLAKLGVPLTVEDWEGDQRLKEQVKERRAAAKATRAAQPKKSDMPAGALDRFVKVSKILNDSNKKSSASLELGLPSSSHVPLAQPTQPLPTARSKQSKKPSTTTRPNKLTAEINPWTLASSQGSPKGTKANPAPSHVPPEPSHAQEPIIISSSPVVPTSPPARITGSACSRTTPTRLKRPKEPSESMPSARYRSPSPGKQKPQLPSAEPTEISPVPAKFSQQPARKAPPTRPFKGSKSGAADNTGVATAQRSIKAYGHLRKQASSPQISTKFTTAGRIGLIEIPSDDENDDDEDEFPPSLSPMARPAAGLPLQKTAPKAPPDISNVAAAAAAVEDNDDDPFGPVPPRAPPQGASRGRPPSDNTAAPAPAPAPAPEPSTTTTKLFIPRTSLGGGLGYFEEVEVGRDEVGRYVMASQGSSSTNGREDGKTKGSSSQAAAEGSVRMLGSGLGSGYVTGSTGQGQGRRAWRLSEVEVYDLTGED